MDDRNDEKVTEEMIAVMEDDSLKPREKIKKLYEMGFSRLQLVDFGFSRAEVYRACPVNPKGRESIAQSNGFHLPAVLKTGAGREMVSAEALLQQIFPDSDLELRGLLRGMMLYRAAQMAVLTDVEIMKGQADAYATIMKPTLHMMTEARKEQDAAAQRARESVMDVAQETAERTLGGAIGYLDQYKPKGPPPKTGEELMAKRVDAMFEMIQNMMFGRLMPDSQGAQGSQVAEGWEYEVETETKSQGGEDGQSGDVRDKPAADGGGPGGGPAPEDGDQKVPPGGETGGEVRSGEPE